MAELIGQAAVQVQVPAQVAVLKPTHIQSQATDPSVPANTTFQQDLTFAGQRQINLIWERTQSGIAVCVVVVTMIASVLAMIRDVMIPNLIAVAFGTVIGFYFSRTNHAAIGGVGRRPSPDQEQAQYAGR